MPTARAVHTAAKNLTITLLLLSTILIPIAANVFQPVQANDVAVSPGKWDLNLGYSTSRNSTSASILQLSYPNSTILTDSVGDLLFTVTLEPNSSQFHCDIIITSTFPPVSPLKRGDCQFSLNIYIPPEFTGLSIGNIWTSFTNNYDSTIIRLSRQSSADEIGPNWWEVSLQNAFNVTCTPLLADPTRHVFLAYPTCPGLSLPSPGITYRTKPQYIRLFDVTSPTTAGRYFFKAFINGNSIGADNFPTLVVKASKDPATISGTLRDLGNRNPFRAG